MASDDGEVGHADHFFRTFFDEGKFFFLLFVTGKAGFDFVMEEVAIDIVDDTEVSWEDFLEEGDGPFFEGFGEEGMIGVSEDLFADIPSFIPFETFFVDKEAHEFWDSDSGVGIVELDGDFFGEFIPIVVVVELKSTEDVFKGASGKEVLLNESEFFSGFIFIVRVEDFGYCFAFGLFFNGFCVTAFVEDLEVEFFRRARFPEAEEVDSGGFIANDSDIPWDTEDSFSVAPAGAEIAAVVIGIYDFAVERTFLCVLRADDLPRSSAFEPVVGVFVLMVINKFLFKEAEFVVDAVADCRVVECSK